MASKDPKDPGSLDHVVGRKMIDPEIVGSDLPLSSKFYIKLTQEPDPTAPSEPLATSVDIEN